MQRILDIVISRIQRKLKKAESAFVREKTAKQTNNCGNAGRVLASGIRSCRLKCQGADEFTAIQCWDEKARGCTLFKLFIPPQTLKEQFRSKTQEEVSLRWPSIGELFWMKNQLELLLKGDKKE